jgi:hypothetical protein
MLLKFGPTLLKHQTAAKIVEQTATIIWKSRIDQNDTIFLTLFWNFPLSCYRFLKSIINENITPSLATTLISLVIPRENATAESFYGNPAVVRLDDARVLMADPRLHYDPIFLLNVCVTVKFWKGMVFLLSKAGRVSDAVAILRQERQTNEIVEFLRSEPGLAAADWTALFDEFVNNEGWGRVRERDRLEFVHRIIANVKDVIAADLIRQRLERNGDLPIQQLLGEVDEGGEARNAIFAKVKEEIERMNAEAQVQVPISGQVKCGTCGEGIIPPLVRFFCGHCYHRGCLAFGENEKPICAVCRGSPGRQQQQTENGQGKKGGSSK